MVGWVGAATTVTVVLTDLLLSSAEVAVMVTVWGEAGATQLPVAALMVPPVAVQTRPLVTPPVAREEKIVVVPVVRRPPRGLTAVRATVCGFTNRVVEAVAPAGLVTTRVKVLGALIGPLETTRPLVPEPMPLSTRPTPLAKVAVRLVLPPKGTGFVSATRLVAMGRGTTVTLVRLNLVGSSLEVAVMMTC